jgi:hypothetical protein
VTASRLDDAADRGPPGRNLGSRALSATWLAGALCIGLALAAGTLLRFWNLRDQVLGGDELHAVRAALAQPLPALLTTYQLADSCIPLTALDRLLLDHGLALDEWRLRLPVLASGLLALLALPLLARRRLPAAGLPLYCALLAGSPLLILYSRVARSYMPATLLGFAAALAFDRWWAPDEAGHAPAAPARSPGPASGTAAGGLRARGATGWAVAYVVLAALAVWFHLGTAPLAVAPLIFAAAELGLAAVGRRGQAREGGQAEEGGQTQGSRQAGGELAGDGDGAGAATLRPAPPAVALAAVALGLAACCALFLVPAWSSLVRLVAAKHVPQQLPAAATWWGVLRLQAGVRAGQWLPALPFWGAALYGAGVLLARRPRFGGYLLALALAQLLGILALSPLGLGRLLVLDRYLLPTLPVALLWVTWGLAAPWWRRQGPLGAAAQRLGAAGLLLAWLAAGPFADPDFRASSFMHHNDLMAFALPRAVAPPAGPPRPYLAVGGPPGTALVELPWPPVWDFGRSFYAYQEIHGLRVLVAAPAGSLPAGRLRLRNRVDSEPASLLGSGARWVAVHRHLAAEEERLRLPSGSPPPRRMPPAAAALLAAAGETKAARLAAAWGPPAFADADVAVWDLRRVARVDMAPGPGGQFAGRPGSAWPRDGQAGWASSPERRVARTGERSAPGGPRH